MKNKLTAIDLFSGAGGLSLAADKLKFKILAAIEMDSNAAKTYKENIVNRLGQQTLVMDKDISKVNINELMDHIHLKEKSLDLLLGGPPCQGFSTHRIRNAGENDPRNKLLLRYFDFVATLMPKVFLVENVPGLLWKRHAEYLSKFVKMANKQGYSIVGDKPFVINARDYGVPQNRKRAFILGIRNDLYNNRLSWPPAPTYSSNGATGKVWRSSSQAFERPNDELLLRFTERLKEKERKLSFEQIQTIYSKLIWGDTLTPEDPLNIHMNHSEEMKAVIASTPLLGSRNESNRVLACHKKHDGHKDVYGRIFPHLPSNTITTGCNNPSKGRFVHPWKNHGITLRHAARLQSFPDEYSFEGGVIAVAKQIGNAVPVQLGVALIKHLKDFLSDVAEEKIPLKKDAKMSENEHHVV